MLKTPGLKYLVRSLDGTPHPLYPGAPRLRGQVPVILNLWNLLLKVLVLTLYIA